MPFQGPPGPTLPSTNREAFAELLMQAEVELRAAQTALSGDASNAARARYANALVHYDTLQGAFPFVAAGLGDPQPS